MLLLGMIGCSEVGNRELGNPKRDEAEVDEDRFCPVLFSFLISISFSNGSKGLVDDMEEIEAVEGCDSSLGEGVCL